jgi:hypothetical protein
MVLLGIDVSKDRLDCALLADGGGRYKGQNPGHAGWYQPLGDLQTQHFRGFRTVDPPSIRKLARGFAPRTCRPGPNGESGFRIWMAAVKSMRVVGCGARGRSL